MKDFPSCFGENGVQVADSLSGSSKAPQNLVTSIYRSELGGHPCTITITWSKNLLGEGICLAINDFDNECLCKAEIKSGLFSKRKGSKSLDVESSKVEVLWDFSSAKFSSGPEPLEGFYLAIVFDHEMVLLIGDLSKEAYKKTNASPPSKDAIFISRREHMHGKRVYSTKAQFWNSSQVHDVLIECNASEFKDPTLLIRVDERLVLQVKRLVWKFRGNQTILVDGLPVEVFWDVYNWLFSSSVGNAVFMFQTSLPSEKLSFRSHHISDSCVLPCSCSQMQEENRLQGLGFSLILYAWKID